VSRVVLCLSLFVHLVVTVIAAIPVAVMDWWDVARISWRGRL
jgi:hypothetical protein